jgi:hypothetical protein
MAEVEGLVYVGFDEGGLARKESTSAAKDGGGCWRFCELNGFIEVAATSKASSIKSTASPRCSRRVKLKYCFILFLMLLFNTLCFDKRCAS